MEREILGNEMMKGMLRLVKAVTVGAGDCDRNEDRIIGEEKVSSTQGQSFSNCLYVY